MEQRRPRASVPEVISIQNEILAQLDRMESATTPSVEMILEMGKLRELHQVLVYRIEILRRINSGEL